MAAYDSINDRYLLVWQDKRNDTNANCGPWSIGYSGTCDPLSSNGDIYGRLVSADGTSLGSDFAIASEPTGQKLDAQWPTVAFDPYRDWETDRKSTRLNSSHRSLSRMPSSA